LNSIQLRSESSELARRSELAHRTLSDDGGQPVLPELVQSSERRRKYTHNRTDTEANQTTRQSLQEPSTFTKDSSRLPLGSCANGQVHQQRSAGYFQPGRQDFNIPQIAAPPGSNERACPSSQPNACPPVSPSLLYKVANDAGFISSTDTGSCCPAAFLTTSPIGGSNDRMASRFNILWRPPRSVAGIFVCEGAWKVCGGDAFTSTSLMELALMWDTGTAFTNKQVIRRRGCIGVSGPLRWDMRFMRTWSGAGNESAIVAEEYEYLVW